jgi:putative lipoprotein
MPVSDVPSSLAGTRWRLVELAGAAPAATGPRGVPTLAFDGAGRVSGHAGVNRYGAGVIADATTLRFGGPVTTRMAGPPEAMALESDYLARLQRVAAWRIAGDRLRLFDASGVTLMVFERAPREGGG